MYSSKNTENDFSIAKIVIDTAEGEPLKFVRLNVELMIPPSARTSKKKGWLKTGETVLNCGGLCCTWPEYLMRITGFAAPVSTSALGSPPNL